MCRQKFCPGRREAEIVVPPPTMCLLSSPYQIQLTEGLDEFGYPITITPLTEGLDEFGKPIAITGIPIFDQFDRAHRIV